MNSFNSNKLGPSPSQKEREIILNSKKLEKRLAFIPFLGALLGALIFFIGLSFEESSIIGLIIGAGVFIEIWIFAYAIKKSYTIRRECIFLIENEGMLYIDNIAAALGINYVKALQEIRFLVDNGILGEAIIDKSKRKIIIKGKNDASSIISVTCPACGASNKIDPSAGGICEYCDTKLTFEK